MRISSLNVANFRGIRDARLSGLGSMVVIAGQNGSGKSCLFDAIRLLKSAYGGYQQNEWHQWMGEFQINMTNKASDFTPMFNDRSHPIVVEGIFEFSEQERAYIGAHATSLLEDMVWRIVLPEAYQFGAYRMQFFGPQFRERQPEVTERVAKLLPNLLRDLQYNAVGGAFTIAPDQPPQIRESVLLSLVFSNYEPKHIGVIDYHGAQRHYGREVVQGINLNLDAAEQQRGQSALYNYGNKYNNVKGEMAGAYIKEMLAERAGVPTASQSSLTATLKSLFEAFFPEKQFLGPVPTEGGSLAFPVKTASGAVHDLDELSAGEKEILYGYLRIRNSAPRDSVILIDEPELHLNPRLIRGLPEFYKEHLGRALNNQMWLVSHSDALLREVVGKPGYNVFHMLPCGSVPLGAKQLKEVKASADLDSALLDLVGDLAAYHPAGKVVIFEGGGDSDFDQRMSAQLFPELAQVATLISGSNKVRVKALHEVLSRASVTGALQYKFYAVTDKDSDEFAGTAVRYFSWDVYHIENFLLEPLFISQALADIGVTLSEAEVETTLKSVAEDLVPQQVRRALTSEVNQALVSQIRLGTDPNSNALAEDLRAAVERALAAIEEIVNGSATLSELSERESRALAALRSSIDDGTWKTKIPGRAILRRFGSRVATTVQYDALRNLIISRMKAVGYKPAGMKVVVDEIVADP